MASKTRAIVFISSRKQAMEIIPVAITRAKYPGNKLYLQREKFVLNTASAAKTVATNLIEQRFIFKRGFSRWAMHFLIMWGCVLSALITFPLVFGWVHFKLEGTLSYRAYVFGFPLNVVQGRSVIAWVTFHALAFTALMVIAGCAIAILRRLSPPARPPSSPLTTYKP